jgi:hypothetical protein
MVLKHTFLVITSLIMIMQSCDKTQDFDRDGLTYKDKLVYNNEFRMNGYYYSEASTNRLIFYLNGTVKIGATEEKLLENECPIIDDRIRRLPYFLVFLLSKII